LCNYNAIRVIPRLSNQFVCSDKRDRQKERGLHPQAWACFKIGTTVFGPARDTPLGRDVVHLNWLEEKTRNGWKQQRR
jgi:hypothetical protein